MDYYGKYSRFKQILFFGAKPVDVVDEPFDFLFFSAVIKTTHTSFGIDQNEIFGVHHIVKFGRFSEFGCEVRLTRHRIDLLFIAGD